jgi:hypothetical protein
MPWIYISDDKGFPAGVTDDDANEIALLHSIRTDVHQPVFTEFGNGGPAKIKGVMDATASMDFFVTDVERWYATFRPFSGI